MRRLQCASIMVLGVAAMLSGSVVAAPTNALLTIGLSQEPDTLNPVISSMSAAETVRDSALWPIVALNETFHWQCYLCVSIPTIANGGARVVQEGGKKKLLVTWEIRPDAVWGDGQPVTGEDMRLAWRIGTASTVTKGAPAAFDGVEAVTVDGHNPRRFTLKYKELRYDYSELDKSFVPIPSHIEGPIFERTKGEMGAYEKQTKYVTDPTNPGLWDGPYRVLEARPGSHVLVIRNERFAAGKPATIRKILFKIIPNTQALEANLAAGTIDMVGGVGMTLDQALVFQKRIDKDSSLKRRFRVVFLDDLIFEHIDFNLDDPVMADLAVRQALTLATDRERMGQALFDGKLQPAAHPYHPMSPYFVDASAAYPYNPVKAKALLEADGWKKGTDGIRIKGNRRLTLTLGSTAQNKMRELVGVFLQQAWREIGVDLRLKNEPARVFFGQSLRHRKYGQMAMYANTLASPDDIEYDLYASSQIPTARNAYAGSNYAAWSNAKVDDLLHRAAGELDGKKRAALIHRVIAAYLADLPQLPLYNRTAVQVVPTTLVPHQLDGVNYPVELKANLWSIDPKVAHR